MSITITRNPNLSKNQNAPKIENEIKKKFSNNWWTGLSPENCAGFDKNTKKLHALPLLNLEICTRQDVLDYFNNSWTLTELLFQSIKTESAYVRSPYHGLRHPMMFYYGHPAVLYVNKLRIAGLVNSPLNPYLEKVLETGVDEMSWDDMSKNEMKWPSIEEVHGYRKNVYDIVVNLIKTHPDLDLPSRERDFLFDSPWWALWMGFEHEKIHFETSSVLLREMPLEFLETPEFWPDMHPSKDNNEIITNEWKRISGKKVELGKSHDVMTYGWDNEYGHREVEVKNFEYTKFQITNREFFEFVKSGAYVNDKYWHEEGKEWRKFRNTKRPTFWVGVGAEGTHEYELRVLFNIIPMPWNWPCEVNYHEAIAYCNWKKEKDNSQYTYRLFTEAELKVLKENKTDSILALRELSYFDSLEKIEAQYSENFNFKYSTAKNVDESIYGNVWHWLMDQFNPLDGFRITPIYDDFSTPCFDGKHQMIMGGSFMSCGIEASHWARFHFRPHFYQHAGFRMARTLDGSADNGATYLVKSKKYVHPKRINALDQTKATDWWKSVNQPLELSIEEMDSLYELTKTKLLDYNKNFSSFHPMGEAHDPSNNKLKKDFALAIQTTKNFPVNPGDFKELLDTVVDNHSKYSQLPGHPGFAAYMAGSDNFISNIAQLVAQTLNPFTGHDMMAPAPVLIEKEVIGWFIDMVGFDHSKSGGYLTTGTSLATLHALSVMRNAKLNGIYNFSDYTIYMSKDAHHCISKTWVMLGFNKNNIRFIELKNHKMDVSQLEKEIEIDLNNHLKPLAVIATLGTTKTGAVDNLEEISKIKEKYNLWLHADGAYGIPFLLTKIGRDIIGQVNVCDSIAFDPHKALSLPYGTGTLLIKDKAHMNFDYLSDSSYMPPNPDDGMGDFSDISPELSRDFRGLRVWLPIKTLGISPFILNLEEKLSLKKYLVDELKQIKNIGLVSEGDLSILTFKHNGGGQRTRELMSQINLDGTLFLSGCIIDDEFVIRICLLGHRLHFDRLRLFINKLKDLV